MKKLKLSKIPGKVLLEITGDCNLSCDYCYVQYCPEKEMTDQKLQQLLKEINLFGVPYLTISGGEPLFAENRFGFLTDYSFPLLTLRTNGVLLNKKNVNIISKLNVKNVVVSLDGHLAQIHELYRGSFRESLQGVKRLIAAGIRVDLAVVVTRDNLFFLEEMHRFFQNTGVQGICYQAVVGYSAVKNKSISLNEKQQGFLRNFIKKKKATSEIKITCSLEMEDRICLLEKRAQYRYPLFFCAAPFGVAYINYRGELNTCVQFADLLPVAGNLKNDSLIALWNTAPVLSVLRKLMLVIDRKTLCEDCFMLDYCRKNCPAGVLREALRMEKLPVCWQEFNQIK